MENCGMELLPLHAQFTTFTHTHIGQDSKDPSHKYSVIIVLMAQLYFLIKIILIMSHNNLENKN